MSSRKKEAVLAELEQIRKLHRGKLRRADIVDFAQTNPKSTLHGLFEWNIKTAARRHWLERAQEIMTTYAVVEVVTETRTLVIPAYVRDPKLKTKEPGYVSTLEKRTREDTTALLRLEYERVMGNIERARDIAAVHEAQHRGIIAMFNKWLKEGLKKSGEIEGL